MAHFIRHFIFEQRVCIPYAKFVFSFTRGPAEITGEVADPCITRKKRLSCECAVSVLCHPVWRRRRRRS